MVTILPKFTPSNHLFSVGNLAHVHFASTLFGLPLKTKENQNGLFTDDELYIILATIFSALFFDVDAPKSYSLNRASSAVAQQLGHVIESAVKNDSGNGLFSGIMDSFRSQESALREYGTTVIRRLREAGASSSDITWSQILPTIVALVPNQGQVFTQIVEYYTSPEGKKHWAEISRLAKQDSKESDDKLHRYSLEAIRINGTFGSYREAQTSISVDENGKKVDIKPGDKVFASFVSNSSAPFLSPA